MLKKCSLFTDKIGYLGHVMRPRELEIAAQTTEAIKNLSLEQKSPRFVRFLDYATYSVDSCSPLQSEQLCLTRSWKMSTRRTLVLYHRTSWKLCLNYRKYWWHQSIIRIPYAACCYTLGKNFSKVEQNVYCYRDSPMAHSKRLNTGLVFDESQTGFQHRKARMSRNILVCVHGTALSWSLTIHDPSRQRLD